MNYQKHYDLLISRAQGRVKPEGYVERHHILPRCMGGDNTAKNLVRLTAREHFVAHLLLVKTYPNVGGLTTAAYLMSRGATNNRTYGWLRKLATYESRKIGKMTAGKGIGIHAQTFEQRSEHGKQAVVNKSGIHAQTKKQLSEHGKQAVVNKSGIYVQTIEQLSERGRQAVVNKTGIHAQTREQHSEMGRQTVINRTGIYAQTTKQLKEIGRQAVVNKSGIHAQTTEQRSILGRTTGLQKWQCQQCGMVSNSGAINGHQRATGHERRVRL